MCRARDYMRLRAGYFARKMQTPDMNIGKVEIAPDDQGRNGDLAQSSIGGRWIESAPMLWRPQGNTIHVEKQPPKNAAHPAWRSQGAVEPQPGLEFVNPVDIAGGFGGVESFDNRLCSGRIPQGWSTANARRYQDERTNPARRGKSRIDGNSATLRAADDNCGSIGGEFIEYCKQVIYVRIGLVGCRCCPETSTVIGNNAMRRPDGLDLGLPHAAVGYASVQENDRRPAVLDLGGAVLCRRNDPVQHQLPSFHG
jgi:hypothetical protein